jgi:hypothetical protein
MTPYELVVTVMREQARKSHGTNGLTAQMIAKRTGLTVTHARIRAHQVVRDRGVSRGAKTQKVRRRGNPIAFFWGDPTK